MSPGRTSEARNPPPFNPRVVLGLLLFGFIAFIAMLYFMGTGEGSRDDNNGGDHAAAMGLNGYAALARLLEADGAEVKLARSEAAYDDEGLLVLTPPLFADPEEIGEILNRRRYTGPTLVILPKWSAIRIPNAAPIEKEPGWVVLGEATTPYWSDGLETPFTLDLSIDSLPDGTNDWSGLGMAGKLPDSEKVQSLAGGAFAPMIRDSRGQMLVGFLDDGFYPGLDEAAGRPARQFESEDDYDDAYAESAWAIVVAAEPDLFNNWGMADRERAALALRIVELAREGDEDPITFDLTLNGLGQSQNLLTLAFTPPFLAATLALILAMLIVGWRGFLRFGPPVAEARAIAFGKHQLVANSAGFIQRTRRLHLLAGPYAALLRRRMAAALGLRHADDAAIDEALQRRFPDAPGFADAAAALEQARTPGEILRAARAAKKLERMIAR